MNSPSSHFSRWFIGSTIAVFALGTLWAAESANFHNAPASAARLQNPFTGDENARAGHEVYAKNCAACHGQNAEGVANIAALATGPTQTAKPGEIFWYITRGNKASGMPSWRSLPTEARWQVVSYLKAIPTPEGARLAAASAQPAAGSENAITGPPPTPPFTDFRYETPGGMRHITAADLPAPYATNSAGNGPKLVPRPKESWPKVPEGFKVTMYASGLENPRLIRTAPNGDMFVAESEPGRVLVFRGVTPDGKPQIMSEFSTGLDRPFGIAFYPLGPNPQWVYVADNDAVIRFPYQNGDLTARGPWQKVTELPGNAEGHWTRDVQFSADGKTMYVSVGSGSNVDDPDTHPGEHLRANILTYTPEGGDMQVYASGIRNPVSLAINPISSQLWCSVNERDALGDNLVPDYITHVQQGGFYGWPWWYTGAHQDPRHAGKHPELRDKVIVADVLLQPHNASLEMMFYEGKQFPAEYRDDIFAAEHGSWNRAIRTGYELIRVPMHHTGKATGEYEEFMTGFVLPDGNVWGRPVGVTAAPDGSLMVTDDGSGSIWHITYTGK